MLNDAQRRLLRIVLALVEDKMRAIEQQLERPPGPGLMSAVDQDVTPELARHLRKRLAAVRPIIGRLKERFDLPIETKLASRELFKGVPQLWVMLQESDGARLRGYGPVDPTDEASLNPDIHALTRLMLEIQNLLLTQQSAEPLPRVPRSAMSCSAAKKSVR